jgi:hypothetical protein
VLPFKQLLFDDVIQCHKIANQQQEEYYQTTIIIYILMTRSAMILCLLGLIAIQSIAKPVPESKLYFTEYCEYYKYPSQKHEVTTDDGYVLTFFRVQAKHTKTFRQVRKTIYIIGPVTHLFDAWTP